MLYNDRSVLENHHLYFTFMIIREVSKSILLSEQCAFHSLTLSLSHSLSLTHTLPLPPPLSVPLCVYLSLLSFPPSQDDSNVLNGLTSEQYSQVRKTMVDIVLATDMSTHFDQIKQLKLILSGQDA